MKNKTVLNVTEGVFTESSYQHRSSLKNVKDMYKLLDNPERKNSDLAYIFDLFDQCNRKVTRILRFNCC